VSVAALDVGGTAIKAGVVGEDGEWLARLRSPTPAGGPEAIADAIADLVAELYSARVRAIGLAVPGIVDEASGVAVRAENLGWTDVPIRALARERCGLPVVLAHDVRAAGFAELRRGAGAGVRDLVYVSIGTGIGAAVIVGGVPLVRGGYAGEIGHVQIGGQEPCACGGRGCLETVASARAIERRYRARGGTASGAQDVQAAARAGDAVAAAVWTEAVEALGAALAWIIGLLAPERIVIGGGLSLAGPEWLAQLDAAMRRRLKFQPPPELRLAQLRDEAGCLGAGLLALEAAA
jgi:glucokinase